MINFGYGMIDCVRGAFHINHIKKRYIFSTRLRKQYIKVI